MTVVEIVRSVEEFGCGLVELTGGEPLLQKEILPLTTTLLDRGFEVLIETSGAHSIEPLDRRAVVILDIKCPASRMTHAMKWSNLDLLKERDEVKFVIADLEDYRWASSVVLERELFKRCTVLFSPVFGQMEPQDLVQWILEDRLPVRFQLQLHKYIWHPEMRGV
jgi:7-carboxy-7-deazaguanine synthase